VNSNDREYYSQRENGRQPVPRRGLINRHPIIANIFIIIIVATLGLVIAYLSLGLFTKHGQSDMVPRVVNMSYTSAVEKIHEAGFKVEIKDSVYFEDVKPGVVVDQFPAAGAIVKPGRKIYLYINSVHPKEVILDPGTDTRQPALRGLSMRQAKAQLQELGFKNIKIEYVLGDTDRVLRVTADGKTVNKMQKVPLNAKIVLVVYDGRKSALADSLSHAAGRNEGSEQYEIVNEEGYEPDPEEQYFEENISISGNEEPSNEEFAE
jgi:beta-lactam-binding protein with PASTA domain